MLVLPHLPKHAQPAPGPGSSTHLISPDNNVEQEEVFVDNSGLAPIYVLRKDHKPFDVTVGGPPGIPVCGASAGYNANLSHHISTIIRPVWKRDSNVCTSTEEMMAAIQDVNKRDMYSNTVLGSTDVSALYPSIDVDFAARIVGTRTS